MESKMKAIVHSLVVILILSHISGCASIVGERSQILNISSSPQRANIVIRDKHNKTIYQGVTPTTVSLEKGDGYFSGQRYQVTMYGIQDNKETVTVDTYPNMWYIFGNIIFGGLIGWLIVDPATGAMWELYPDKVHASLYD
jgi:hypothetical protein